MVVINIYQSGSDFHDGIKNIKDADNLFTFQKDTIMILREGFESAASFIFSWILADAATRYVVFDIRNSSIMLQLEGERAKQLSIDDIETLISISTEIAPLENEKGEVLPNSTSAFDWLDDRRNRLRRIGLIETKALQYLNGRLSSAFEIMQLVNKEVGFEETDIDEFDDEHAGAIATSAHKMIKEEIEDI